MLLNIKSKLSAVFLYYHNSKFQINITEKMKQTLV